MKKVVFAICAMAIAMAACRQSGGFKVNGVAEGFTEGDTLYFYDEMGQEPTDTLIVKDGKFALQGEVDSVKLCSVVAADGSAGGLFFKEEGDIVLILSRANPPKVGGTKSNNAWQEVNDLQGEYSAKFDSLTAPLYKEDVSDELRQRIIDDYQTAEKELLSRIIDVAEANADNALGYFLVTSLAGGEELGGERLKAIIDKMPAEYQSRGEIVALSEDLEAAMQTAVGETMPDFTLPTPEGKPLSALDEVSRHKVTILDFWASWCGPCCQEMPNMVSIYGQYKDKGLGILGISLDSEKEAWTKAVADMGMTWPQVSDLDGWQTQPVELFQVRAIPFVVVVDEKGVILEKGLRGEALRQFVAERLE